MADNDQSGLLEAVASGDVLAILREQRLIIAKGLVSAADNTRPQYSNELNKLNKLIADEEERRRAVDVSEEAAGKSRAADDTFDAEAV